MLAIQPGEELEGKGLFEQSDYDDGQSGKLPPMKIN